MKNVMNSKGINNLEIDKKGRYLIVSVNPKIYPLEVIYSAAYVFIDRAYLLIDGDPEEEVFVQMRPKNKNENMENLGNEFNNELLNYAVYVVQAMKNQPLRKAIIERALMTNSQGGIYEEERCEKCGGKLKVCPDCGEKYCPNCEEHEEEEYKEEEELEKEDFVIDDPLEIAKPWTSPEEEKDEKRKAK